MAADPVILTRTQKNLWNAIVSEALANLKYNAFAQRAMQEGHPEVAQIFQEVAGAETIHGINHLRVTGDMASTAENLRSIMEGEAQEAATIYPMMIREALEEGNQEAADSFTLAMERERRHLESFTEALNGLEAKLAAQNGTFRLAPAPEIPVMPASIASVSLPPVRDGSSEAAAAADRAFDRDDLQHRRRRGRPRDLARRPPRPPARGGLRRPRRPAQHRRPRNQPRRRLREPDHRRRRRSRRRPARHDLHGHRRPSSAPAAERDVQRAEIERESRELDANPAEELAELVVLYQREGMTFQEARQMADEISQDRDLWLKTLVEKELGISTEETASPVKDAMVMGLAFITGAAIPLVPHFFLTGDTAIGVSVGGTLAGLFALGLLKGRLVERSPLLQGLEILGIGTISAGVGYALGELIPPPLHLAERSLPCPTGCHDGCTLTRINGKQESAMATSELFEHPLSGEIMAYQRMQDDLEREFFGRWVIIHDSEKTGGDYESYREAEAAARELGLDVLACSHPAGWCGLRRFPVARRVTGSQHGLRGCVTKCNQVGLSLLSIRWTIAI